MSGEGLSPRTHAVRMPRPPLIRRVKWLRYATHLPGLVGSLALLALFLHAGSARTADQPPNTSATTAPSSPDKSPLETITVEARRQLERQVSHYVFTVVVHTLHDSLARWDAPICPLVAGLTRERAEFTLSRISQIATAAGAPLAAEQCKANFYVIVTPEPDLLLKKWWRRDPNMYNKANGMGHINSFLHSSRPVRCWYNSELRSSDGGIISPDARVAGLSGMGLEKLQLPTIKISHDTRLLYTAVQSVASVIVVVDANRTRDLTVGQLADYVAMVGLAEIRSDADLADTPTILRLFQDSNNPPQGLSAWDEAFLYSLYHTDQASVLQTSSIKTSMLKRIAPP
jgi:hypothetical protein